jgi:DNA polymerase-4
VRYADFTTFTRQITLPASTNDTGEIYRSAVAILDGIHLRKSVRLFGISLSAPRKDGDQMSLFQDPEQDKRAAMV